MKISEEHKTILIGYLLAIILALQIFSAINHQLIERHFQCDLFDRLCEMRLENLSYLNSVEVLVMKTATVIIGLQLGQSAILNKNDKEELKDINDMNKSLNEAIDSADKVHKLNKKFENEYESFRESRNNFIRETKRPLRNLEIIDRILTIASTVLIMVTMFLYAQVLNSIGRRL